MNSILKITIPLLASITLSNCNSGKNNFQNVPNTKDTVYIIDTVYKCEHNKNPKERDWQEGFGLTHDPKKDSVWGKPVNYYLEQDECSALAFDFYYGYLRPTDNGSTAELLKLAPTENNKLRPFYRWILNKTIEIQDGALGEYTGLPARQYATKFPTEFFEYMDIDPSGQKYRNWSSSISYSGFYATDNYDRPQIIRKQFSQAMKSNCTDCDKEMKKRIEKLALDCFFDKSDATE